MTATADSSMGGPARDQIARRMLPLVAGALACSPFSQPGRWRQGVIILEKEGRRVTSRGDFAAWARAHDLPTVAREALTRRVPPGSVLVWISVDVEEVAAAGFLVFDIATALRPAKVTNGIRAETGS